MNISVQTAKDALWWVQDGLDNCDLTRKEWRKTVRCRDELKGFIKQHENEQDASPDADKGWICGYCNTYNRKEAVCRRCGDARR